MPLTHSDFEYVRKLVRKHSAIAIEDTKAYLAESRLSALAKQEGISDLNTLMQRLRGDAGNLLERKVVESMTTNETLFFRDHRPFDALRSRVIPEILERNAKQRTLTIWSAACSTGQEPYSIAMLLDRNFPQLSTWEVRIIASDLSTEVLERAKRGIYTQLEVNRGLPADYLLRYFHRDGLEWKLRDAIRTSVFFARINLIENWPGLPPLDIVFLRNVMIYFDVPMKKVLLARIARALQPQGYLALGGAETTVGLDDSFAPLDDRNQIFQLQSTATYAGPSPRPRGAQGIPLNPNLRVDQP